ncbi:MULTISPECIES: hypothetical protein [Streptomycetaceae]|uniref:Uncharacterized protein n=1 Tax=Streptantibioticus cattleyicolor (strain ATCC 35852 / DSM 46488 / JCM 4925 / NBRC 14057 / NRRL 8057) TaxID=1003195 RepID=F8JS12_STREN|nr:MULTISPECIES: hypothetical protein [Streptomycetaceae]AEW92921.1 hypothetical protein SCATT_05500 [Streptantibioticus cattleyicolor NRRL 8057 = DSM 46488]MYS57670.1 hypothetical protein [Streptomyces sp. SID5468]CCB73281.1 protein of unknown function [Streptantibioticus cattleyicolor NRRL 8057 = DSM 46488]
MPRTMYDAVTPANIPANATMVAGYADGRYANLDELRARFPAATIISIAVRWTTRAQVLDVESGDATPEQAVQWCTQTMADTPNHELTVYCNTSQWPSVRAAFQAAGITEPNYWVAAYDGDPTIPAGAIAKQYLGDYHGYDKSAVVDYWPGVDTSPPPGGEFYPGANRSHWYEQAYPGDPMRVNTIIWHSTETTVLPDYGGGSIAPTLTAVPNWREQRLDWWQHFPFDTSARALVHDRALIGTNTLNVAQIEIVGTCDPATHAAWTQAGIQHLYMPALPGWAVRDLAACARWAHTTHGVPLTSGLRWLPYPASFGANNGVRMDAAAWSAFRGHAGHMHVPQNDHGDPGVFPIAAILSNTPVLEDDMPQWHTGPITAGSEPTVVLVPHGNAWQAAPKRTLHLGMDQLGAPAATATVRVAVHNGIRWGAVSTVKVTAAGSTVDVDVTGAVKVSLQTTTTGLAYAVETW